MVSVTAASHSDVTQQLIFKEEPVEVLPELADISISFTVHSVLQIELRDGGLSGFTMAEVPVEPYQKDYDLDAGEGPSRGRNGSTSLTGE